MDTNCNTPWETGSGNALNMQNQATAYQALFERIWNQDWFLGGFIWKWHHNHPNSGGSSNNDFTPQNKLAENTIRDAFAD